MIRDRQFIALQNALRSTEQYQNLVNENIANANTLGYKRYDGFFSPLCNTCKDFDGVMKEAGEGLTLNVTKDERKGPSQKVAGKEYEGSNVSVTEEMEKLAQLANMTRSILTSIQIENRLQQEVINLTKS